MLFHTLHSKGKARGISPKHSVQYPTLPQLGPGNAWTENTETSNTPDTLPVLYYLGGQRFARLDIKAASYMMGYPCNSTNTQGSRTWD